MTTKLTEISTVRFAPESGHWYTLDGKVVDAVPGADGRKMVKPDIRHARKFGLVPGVTTITRQLKSEGLDKWKQKQLLLAALTLPRIENEPLDFFATRVVDDFTQQASAAADLGTKLHAALNRYFLERLLPDYEAAVNAVHAVDEWLRELGATDIRGEVGFCVPGQFGGTADLTFRLGPITCVADSKTVEDTKLTKYEPYDENGWQLAGYGRGLGLLPSDRYFNIGIGRGSGLIAVSEWSLEDMTANFTAFGHLLALWQIRNKWTANKEDRSEN